MMIIKKMCSEPKYNKDEYFNVEKKKCMKKDKCQLNEYFDEKKGKCEKNKNVNEIF